MKPTYAARLCALLSLVGLAITGYLVFLHLGLMRGELLGGSACGGHGALNCHAVTASRWAELLGIPLAFWGLLSYVVMLALSLFGAQSDEDGAQSINLIWLLALVMVGMDAWLFYLMAVKIRYFCLFCLITYGVNLLLLVVAWQALGTSPIRALVRSPAAIVNLLPSSKQRATWLFWGVVVIGGAGIAGIHASTLYLSRGTLKNQLPQIREFLANQPRVAISSEGDPTRGAAKPVRRLIEFSDFMCPVCQRASKINEIILASHRDDLQLVFKNYPLDMACNSHIQRTPHEGACQIAAASECAHQQGKFWAFHDQVFEAKPPYDVKLIETDAASSGLDMAQFQSCMSSGQGMEAVKKDIEEAVKAQVSSTPTYVLNDIVLRGALTPTAYDDFIEALEDVRR